MRTGICRDGRRRGDDFLVLCANHGPDGAKTQLPHLSDMLTVWQKRNFLRDQSGMKQQLSTLQQLISVMDPELYRHLGKRLYRTRPGSPVPHIDDVEKTDGLNLFFCFRYAVSHLCLTGSTTTKVFLVVGFSSPSSGSFPSKMSFGCGRSSGQTTTARNLCSS